MDSARNTPANYHAGTASDPATDISTETRFYAKMVHNAYRALDTDRPSHIVSQANADHYRTDTWSGTIKSMSTNNEAERRAVYYKRAIQSSDIATIYLPIDRDREELLPIYLSIRGTYDIWDIFRDVNFLLNYGTGSTLNLTGYTSKLNQLFIDIVEALNAVPNHPLVITSHSLGSKYALDIWKYLYNQPAFANRLHKNVMFNPFLIIDDDYSLLSTYPPLFRNTIETHIIDGDIASVVYKNHPINPTGMTIYANIVDRDHTGWIDTLYDLTYASSLDVRNHQLGAFTEEITVYPIITNIAYIADAGDRRIRSVRGYNMTSHRPDGSEQSYVNQAIYLEYDDLVSPPQYLGNNPVMESTNWPDFYDLQFELADIRDMIYRNDQWSYPMYLDIAMTRDWYLFRVGLLNNEMAYYLSFAAQPNELSYIQTWSDTDYTNRFAEQEHNLEKAYETITEAQLLYIQQQDPTPPIGAVHRRAQWFVSMPPVAEGDPHSGYGTGERRSLSALPQNILRTRYNSFSENASSINLTQAYEIQCITTAGESGPRRLQATPTNVDDITSSVNPFVTYWTMNNPTTGYTWTLQPDLTSGGDLHYSVASVEVSNYNLGDKFRVASWDSAVGGEYTIQTVEGNPSAVLDFISTGEDDTYYIQDAITKRYLEIFEAAGASYPTNWGTSELDFVFWQFNTAPPLTDYHKFTIVAV